MIMEQGFPVIFLKYVKIIYIREDKDSVLLFKTRQEKWLEKEFWGMEDDKTSNFF